MIERGLSHKIYCTSFLLAILVVGIHCSTLDSLNPELPGFGLSFTLQRFFIAIGDVAVPMFFAISGYLLFSKFSLESYPRMLLKKVFTLVIPYFLFSLIGFLAVRVFYPLFGGSPISLPFPEALFDFLLAKHCPQIWFVRPLALYCLASPLLYFLFKGLRRFSILIPAALLVLYLFVRPDYYGLLLWIPPFSIGAYLSFFKVKVENAFYPRVVAVVSLCLLLLFAFLLSYFKVDFEEKWYFAHRFLSPVLLWLSLDLFRPLFERERIGEVFKTSPFIFFSHIFFVYSLKLPLTTAIRPDSNYLCLALFFLVWFLSASLTATLGYLLRRFAKPVYRVLLGRQ